MAITWGAYRNGVRIGVQQKPYAAPTSSTSSIKADVEVWIDRKVNIADTSNSWSWSGSAVQSGSGGPFGVSGSGQKLVTVIPGATVSLAYGATKTANVAVNASTIDYAGGTLTVSATYTYPARPYAAPAAPQVTVSGSGATRTVAWSTASSASAPAQKVTIQQSINGGAWSPLSTSSLASGSVSVSVSENRRYVFRAQASNANATGPWGVSPAVYTKPAAPTGPSAVKLADGSVQVTWTDVSPYNNRWNIRDTPDGGMTWLNVATNYTGQPPWVHAGPPLTPHTYQVQAVTPDGQLSAWSASSNVVVMLQAPSAPTNLGPTTIQALGEPTTLTWRRVHPDYTPQTAYQVRYRAASIDPWTEMAAVSSSVEQASVTFASSAVEWQVRTKGLHAGWGPYSASGSFTLGNRPVVEVISPDPAVGTSRLVVAIGYSSADDSPQASASVEVVDSSGSSRVFYRALGAGETTADFSATPIAEGRYAIIVSATDSRGLRSLPTSYQIVVDYLPPQPTEVVEYSWDPESGSVTLALSNPDGDGVTTTDTVSVTVFRGRDEIIQDDLPPNSGILDRFPSTLGQEYRIIAWSDEGASSETIYLAQPDRALSGWFYLTKPNSSCRFRTAASLKQSVKPSVVTELYAERREAVSTYGYGYAEDVSLGGTLVLDEGTDWKQVRAVAIERADAVARTPAGDRLWVTITGADVTSEGKYSQQITMSLTRVEGGLLW